MLTVDDLTGSALTTQLLNKIYPVGSIYISYVNKNPSTFLGGTWSAFASGRTLVGINTSDTDFATVGKTGGSKTVTLAANQIPAHSHSFYGAGDSGHNDSSYELKFQSIVSWGGIILDSQYR